MTSTDLAEQQNTLPRPYLVHRATHYGEAQKVLGSILGILGGSLERGRDEFRLCPNCSRNSPTFACNAFTRFQSAITSAWTAGEVRAQSSR